MYFNWADGGKFAFAMAIAFLGTFIYYLITGWMKKRKSGNKSEVT